MTDLHMPCVPDEGFSCPPERFRVYKEDGEWFIDGYSPSAGTTTAQCWTADTYAEILALIDEFQQNVLEGYHDAFASRA